MTGDIHKKIKSATVAMGVLNKSDSKQPFTILGSGFCVDSCGLVVTNQHVISAFMEKSIPEQIANISEEEKKKDIQMTGPVSILEPYAIFYKPGISPQQLVVVPSKVDLIMAKTDYDLGIVKLLPHKYLPDGYPFLEIEEYGNLHEGQDVGLCGFPLGNHLLEQIGTVTSSFSRGIISSIIPAQGIDVEFLKGFQLDITATHGNSGGPVYSLETGKVFGVLQRCIVDSEGKLFEGMVKAEPIYPIMSQKCIEALKNAQPGSPPSFEEIFGNGTADKSESH